MNFVKKSMINDGVNIISSEPCGSGFVAPSKDNLILPDPNENPKDSYLRCNHCGYCRHVCKVYNISWCETDYAGGRIRIIKALERKKIAVDKEQIVPTLFRCMLCGLCKTVCPVGVDTISVFTEFRKWANNEGVLHPALETIKQSILDKGNPYMEQQSDRFLWCKTSEESSKALERSTNFKSVAENKSTSEIINKKEQDPPKVGYFPGCTNAYRSKELAISTSKILTKLGINFILFPKEQCCGSVLFRTGLEDDAIDLAKHNIDLIRKTGVEEVIFSCSCCFSTFMHDYVRVLGQELEFKPYHLTQYILKTVNEKGIKLKYENLSSDNKPLLVTYHDPCHLGRYCNVYEEPRNLLKKIEGLLLVEMKHNREMAWCCGAGGGVKSLYGDLSERVGGFGLRETRNCMVKMRENRVRKAVATQAQVLVTACVFCRNNFYDAAVGTNLPIKVRDISQILEECKFEK